MRVGDLPIRRLQDKRLGPVQNADPPFRRIAEPRRVFAAGDSLSACLDADEFHVFIADKLVKESNSIRPAADARDQRVGQSPGLRQNLRARFAPDHRLKIAHHCRVGVRAERRAEQIMSRVNIHYPIADRFVDRVFQRLASAVHAAHVRAQQLHSEHVWLLSGHVHRAHVNDALQTEQSACGGRRHAVLPRARFGDDAGLAHAFCQQRLAERVVDLVRPGVGQVFTLEVNLCAA